MTITGAVPKLKSWWLWEAGPAALGYADDSGNFTISGNAYPGNVGTTNELWTVGGAMVQPEPTRCHRCSVAGPLNSLNTSLRPDIAGRLRQFLVTYLVLLALFGVRSVFIHSPSPK